MKVNQKILSIPPYISTAWKNVISLHVDRKEDELILIIGLVNGATIEIPHLESSEIELIFTAHQKYLEQEPSNSAPKKATSSPNILPGISHDNASASIIFPFRLGIEGNTMANLFQHNSEASDSPPLPDEILEKIITFSKALGFENLNNFSKPEPHCNCMHCQILRAIRGETFQHFNEELIDEDEVSDKDLKFRDWDILQTEDKLFVVNNPLNVNEKYTVYLGKPIGCTCGQPNCEHIRAVLNS